MKLPFKFYGITDRTMAGERYFEHLEFMFVAGVRVIQIREKDLAPKALLELCLRVQALAKKYGVRVLLNDRTDIVLSLNLDGVHLTENSLPTDRVRRLIGKNKFIGVSAHSMEGVKTSAERGADFVVLGPVATTPSKLPGHAILSLEEFQAICRNSDIPVFALGGVTVDNAKTFVEAGAAGVAGISLLMGKNAPERIQELKNILGNL